MKKTLIAASLSALTLIAAGAAMAQPGASRPDAHRPDFKADLTRTELVSRLDARFARMDFDKDGKLTQADRKAAGQARVVARFKAMDANGDGNVTLAEMQAAHDKRFADRAQKPEAKDGKAAKAHAHHGKRGFGHRHGFGMKGGKMDANGDGVITLEEFHAPALAWFDKADADRNGVLTAAEREAAFKAMRAERAERKAAARK